jgi:hypothetical protein
MTVGKRPINQEKDSQDAWFRTNKQHLYLPTICQNHDKQANA